MITRDIVDMVYDDGLTPKRALEFDRRPSSRAACEFCEAIVALQSMIGATP